VHILKLNRAFLPFTIIKNHPIRIIASGVLVMALLMPLVGITAKPDAKSYIVYIGTYTRVASKGIYGYRFTPATGDLAPLGLIQEAVNPSWLVEHPNHRFLYATNEHPTKIAPGNSVTAYARDEKTGKLTLLNTVSSKGEGPAHLAIDKTGKILVAANFISGSVATFPIHPDGRLGEAAASVALVGTAAGPSVAKDDNGVSPTDSHNHCVVISPDNRFVLVCNIGMGKVFVFRLNAATGALEQNGEPFTVPTVGWRPRHLTFHPNGKYVYMISGSMQVTVAAYDAAAGTLKEIQSAPLTAVTAGMSEGSEVQIDRAGKFVYASTRAVDASLRTSHLDGTLHVLAVDPATGKLTPVQHISSMGDTPRTFALDPSGKYLFAGNEYSGTMAIFAIDRKTGMLSPTGKVLKDVPEPSCILFVAEN